MHQLEKNSIEEFSKWAENYDNPLTSITFRKTNEKIVQLLNPKRNSSFLDVGCGSGILIKNLLALNSNIKLYGLDITPKMVEVAKRKFGNEPNVEITLGSAVKMPYQDNTFDYVTCASSFHHHPDPLQSAKEMVRVLKPGGRLLILDMCIEGLLRKILFKVENVYHNEGKVYRLTNKEMYDLYKKVGLKDIKQSTFLYFTLITVGIK
ncbi:16S rRNA (cytosine(1402)-N(4))-methyltransferase [Candidatus Roizmanbacteria bacterium CG17_big_fil_post_rev_8_21_14_2_50_39_7]|uniref:16S rRNA (Cytosine(1402)-N(4))-methyltransferase n=2 Tax=Candidatus Roizmaniibacteriota TaxID=1752723 RepID=A0A2M7EL48_9BACT|nr:MAG: 16S rRNA (cytosine(1402)-N(4))-methyltransferase [Candidatus Roizmanbacteria bacterium CG03_land_8_20_14_0_80_39_12]PIV71301.1 MAG: 16S rRNA (cytosine(1402)-N(4))-methyltransferase [Candidatus Roizmanbacteria bacterium CG17_big_fil_post_rev_8_21_14_2_50_39_7]